jgi:hypothetical protein
MLGWAVAPGRAAMVEPWSSRVVVMSAANSSATIEKIASTRR